VFTDIAPGTILGNFSSGRGVAWSDLDGDGRPDILLANYGAPSIVFQNRAGVGRHWLAIRLADACGPPGAIGARVVVSAGGRTQTREVSGGSGYYSQNDATLYFGLGDAATSATVSVFWPGDPVAKVYPVSALDQRLTLQRDIIGVPGDGEALLQAGFQARLHVAPNPCRAGTTIRFTPPSLGQQVTLGVFDLSGRCVRTLVDARFRVGDQTVLWTGDDDRGVRVPSGVYVLRLRSGSVTASRKITLLE
jgi:hypothetical protein